MKQVGSLLFVLALVGCGDGGDGYCVLGFEGGTSNWACTSCSGVDPLDESDDFDRAIDGSSSSYTEFGLSTGGQMKINVRARSDVFPAGSNAGALMRFPSGIYNSIGVEFTAMRNGVTVASTGGSGNTAAGGNVASAGSDAYFGFTPQANFDEVQAVVSVTGNVSEAVFRVYEFCGTKD